MAIHWMRCKIGYHGFMADYGDGQVARFEIEAAHRSGKISRVAGADGESEEHYSLTEPSVRLSDAKTRSTMFFETVERAKEYAATRCVNS